MKKQKQEEISASKIGSSRSVGQNGGRKHQLFCCLVQPNGARHSLRGDRPTRQAFLAAVLPRQNYACARRAVAMDRQTGQHSSNQSGFHVGTVRRDRWRRGKACGQRRTNEMEKG